MASSQLTFKRYKVEQPMFVIATSDKDRIVVNGRVISANPGTLVSCKSGQWVEFGTAADEGKGLYLLHYETGLLPSASNKLGKPSENKTLLFRRGILYSCCN